jgi:hypothetical protein
MVMPSVRLPWSRRATQILRGAAFQAACGQDARLTLITLARLDVAALRYAFSTTGYFAKTSKWTAFKSTELGPTMTSKIPGSTTRFIS